MEYPKFSTSIALILVCGLVGCLDDELDTDPAEDDLTIVVEADKSQIQAKEKDLQSKRSELLQEQSELRKQKAELRKRFSNLSSKDKQLRAKLKAEEKRIEEQEKQILSKRQELDRARENIAKQKSDLLDRIAQLTARKGGLTIEQREQIIAKREAAVAKRERSLARRETQIAERERKVTEQLAQLTKLMEELKNAASGLGKTVVVAASRNSSSGPVTRRSVRRSYLRVRNNMKKRGILAYDLSDRGRGAISQYESAMKEKDFQTAQDAVDMLAAIVEAIKVDAPFIQHKFNRINSLASGKQMGAGVEKLLAEVTAAFTNGNYAAANAKLNRIYRLIKK